MRHRLLSIMLLSVVMSALSLSALVHVLSLSTAQRVERASEGVREQTEWLATRPDTLGVLESAPAMSIVGMLGGVLPSGGVPERLPAPWRPAFARALVAGRTAAATIEQEIAEGTLVLSVRPMSNGRLAWAGAIVRPPSYLRFWQSIVVGLTIGTALLVTVALSAIITFRRSASALRLSLASLAKDLSTPIPRSPIREFAEVSDGIALLAKDLAKAREEHERLSHELAQQERLAALGRVVAGVAHEVRNPLASIKLHLDLAAETTSIDPDVKKAVVHASSEITRLDRLVQDLLVVAGRRTGPLRSVLLGQLVQRRVDALAPWSATHQVIIHANGDAEAMADPDSLSRALDNLLRNAVEASPRGGTVDVRVLDERDVLRVRVEDHGVGISPEHSVELFEPFFTTKPEGTGLGLAISRAIARAHGGELGYRRQNGTTTFELSLARGKGGAEQLS